jgi:hypothetical protein
LASIVCTIGGGYSMGMTGVVVTESSMKSDGSLRLSQDLALQFIPNKGQNNFIF